MKSQRRISGWLFVYVVLGVTAFFVAQAFTPILNGPLSTWLR